MQNLYDAGRAGMFTNKFEVNELLFVEYECPIPEPTTDIWTPRDYLVHVISGRKAWRTPFSEWTAERGQTLFIKKGAFIIDQFFEDDFCVLLFFIPDDFIRHVVREIAANLGPVTAESDEPAIQVENDARVPVFSIGLGHPGPDIVSECHRHDIKVIAMVTTVQDALAVGATGLDGVVAQGAEAGGHRSHFEKPLSSDRADVGTIALVPEVVDAVRIPVIAAGGMVDGRGLITALALGASGVLMGSRFLVTRESMAPEVHKKAMIEQTADTTVVTDTFSGRFARALRNTYTEQYAQAGAPVLPFPSQLLANGDIRQESATQGRGDYIPLWSGQGVGLIHDLPGAGDVIEAIIQEARQVIMERLPQSVQLGRWRLI